MRGLEQVKIGRAVGRLANGRAVRHEHGNEEEVLDSHEGRAAVAVSIIASR